MRDKSPGFGEPFTPSSIARADTLAWHQRLRVRVIVAALLIAAWIAAGIFYVMQREGKTYLERESYKLIEQTGNTVVSALSTRLQEISALNRALAATSSTLDKNEAAFMKSLPPVIDFNGDAGVEGGGYWAEPHAFSPELERRAFFWARDERNALAYTNSPNEAELAYYREEWYVPSQFEAANRCYWSASYIDPHTFEPMVTCATPLRENDKFIGATSLDIALGALTKLTHDWSRRTGGYIFLVDRNNRFIAHADTALTRRTVVDAQGQRSEEFLRASELAQMQPAFADAADALAAVDQDIVAKARASDGAKVDATATAIRAKMAGGRDKIDASTAERLAATLLDPYKETYSLNSTTLMRTQSLGDDPVLKAPSVLLLFHVPDTYWKLGIVKPVDEVVAVAHSITNYLIGYLLATMLAGLTIAYFLFNRWLIVPVRKISDTVRRMATLIVERRHHELRRHHVPQFGRNEIGALGRDINAFADEIALSEGKLAEANTLLERRVQQRTEELSSTLDQLKSSQAQLVQSEKMASLGQMVAGIAHEINTPLGYVKNNVLLTREMLDRYVTLCDHVDMIDAPRGSAAADGSPLTAAIACSRQIRTDNVTDDTQQLIADALYGVEQISELVTDLRNFSRLDEAKVKEVSVHECIDSALNISRNQLKAKVEIIKSYGDVPKIACSPSQINQVFVNLFNNAAQAIEGAGKIMIHTSCADNFVHVEVKDNGRGIPKDVIGRIFEPFFTTKPVGQGTGLGLSIIYQIVQQHGGHIRVASELGRGTRFIVSLPVGAGKQRAA